VDKVVGLDDVRAELVVVKTPDGSEKLELTKFHTSRREGAYSAPANRLGIRQIAFHDLDTIVDGLRAKGLDLTGEIQNYESAATCPRARPVRSSDASPALGVG
jgi:hypothetical protein